MTASKEDMEMFAKLVKELFEDLNWACKYDDNAIPVASITVNADTPDKRKAISVTESPKKQEKPKVISANTRTPEKTKARSATGSPKKQEKNNLKCGDTHDLSEVSTPIKHEAVKDNQLTGLMKNMSLDEVKEDSAIYGGIRIDKLPLKLRLKYKGKQISETGKPETNQN